MQFLLLKRFRSVLIWCTCVFRLCKYIASTITRIYRTQIFTATSTAQGSATPINNAVRICTQLITWPTQEPKKNKKKPKHNINITYIETWHAADKNCNTTALCDLTLNQWQRFTLPGCDCNNAINMCPVNNFIWSNHIFFTHKPHSFMVTWQSRCNVGPIHMVFGRPLPGYREKVISVYSIGSKSPLCRTKKEQ